MGGDDADRSASPEENQKQFDEWFDRNHASLVKVLRSRMNGIPGYTASDAVMSAYADLRRQPFTDPIESPLALIRLIAWRKYCWHLRQQYLAVKSRPHVARPDGVDDPGADQPSAEETVAFLIAKLAPDQKVVLEGRLNGLTYDEIARHLHERGLPEGCVPNHVKYLWKKLVKAWRDEGVRDAESP